MARAEGRTGETKTMRESKQKTLFHAWINEFLFICHISACEKVVSAFSLCFVGVGRANFAGIDFFLFALDSRHAFFFLLWPDERKTRCFPHLSTACLRFTILRILFTTTFQWNSIRFFFYKLYSQRRPRWILLFAPRGRNEQIEMHKSRKWTQ